MAVFKRVTQTSGQPVDINFEFVSSMEQTGGYTRIYIGAGNYDVNETVDQIAMAPALRFNDTIRTI
jgi:hypothetical protein